MSDPFMIGILLIFGPLMVVLNAFVASFVASFFLGERESKVAGFAFVIGLSGSFTRIEHQGWIADVAASAAVVFGLVAVWWLYFKREKRHG